jgi:hypothetical protein
VEPERAGEREERQRPPKQAISPSVVRTLNRPSGSGDHHGARLKPPSPTPFSVIVAEYSNVSPFRNWIGSTPFVEKRHVCRLAKPAQNGGTTFWSSIEIRPGNKLLTVRTETGSR